MFVYEQLLVQLDANESQIAAARLVFHPTRAGEQPGEGDLAQLQDELARNGHTHIDTAIVHRLSEYRWQVRATDGAAFKRIMKAIQPVFLASNGHSVLDRAIGSQEK